MENEKTLTQAPQLVWDGDCGFCRRSVEWLQEIAGDQLNYAPFQAVYQNYPDVPKSNFEKRVYLFKAGQTYAGAEAIFEAMAINPNYQLPLRIYRKINFFRFISNWFYSIVAKNRVMASKATRLFETLVSQGTSRQNLFRYFLILLAVSYFSGFFSFLFEWEALFSNQGLTPYSKFKSLVEGQSFLHPLKFPGLFWWFDSWQTIKLVPFIGIAASCSLFLGFFTRSSLLICWFSYLTLVPMGEPFTHFQWDNLLIEAGFLAFLAGLKRDRSPYGLGVLALQILAFKVFFSSGYVKVFEANPNSSWRNLSALIYHFETQPLPHYLSWFWHNLPDFLLKFGCLATLAIQLICPVGLFLPGRTRKISLGLLLGHQLLIMASGNYNFFNILTIGIALLFLKDQDFSLTQSASTPRLPLICKEASLLPIFSFLILLSFFSVLTTVFPQNNSLRKIRTTLQGPVYYYHINNNYGLFANMTLKRPEIIFEVSEDGETWTEIHTRFKPGKLDEPPPFVMPLQPRIDWHFWFAALKGKAIYSPWLKTLAQGLLNKNPYLQELFLLPKNVQINHVRAKLYQYHFTSWEERRLGIWWKREELDLYLAPLSKI